MPAAGGVGLASSSPAAALLADPTNINVVVVGDAKQFLPALRSRFSDIEVIRADSFRADSATVTRLWPSPTHAP